MKALKWFAVAALLCFSMAAFAQTRTVFNLTPIPMTNGWKVTGTITTDGTVGALSSANIVDWNLKVVQTTDLKWTERDSNDLNISGVVTDGSRVMVTTSPDGVQDGGALYFGRPSSGGNIPTNVVMADFTQLGINLGYVGGIAGWQDELGGLNFAGLNQRNHSYYRAALAVAGQPNVFRVTVPEISASPFLMTVFGTFTTDGTTGALAPKNIIAWNITARTQDITYYTKANSEVMSAIGVSSDGTTITVAHAGGQLMLGISGARPTYVDVADFTNKTYPNGFADYYMGNFGVTGSRGPLTRSASYIVATK